MNRAGVTPKSLIQKWQFGIEIAGFDAMLFEKSNFPELDFDEVKFDPAGSIFSQKTAGRAVFKDITVSKAKAQDRTDNAMLNWVQQCLDFKAGVGTVPMAYMRDIDLVNYDRAGNEVRRYRLYGTFIKNAKFGDGDGGSATNDIESMTLGYQYFDIV